MTTTKTKDNMSNWVFALIIAVLASMWVWLFATQSDFDKDQYDSQIKELERQNSSLMEQVDSLGGLNEFLRIRYSALQLKINREQQIIDSLKDQYNEIVNRSHRDYSSASVGELDSFWTESYFSLR